MAEKTGSLKNPPRYSRNNIATWNFIIDNYLTYTVAMAVKNVFKCREHEPLKSAEKAWVYIEKALEKLDVISTTYSSYAIANVNQSLTDIKREDFMGLDELQYQFIFLSLKTVTMNKSVLKETLLEMQSLSEQIIISLIKGKTFCINQNGFVQEFLVVDMDEQNFCLRYRDGRLGTLNKQETIGYLYSFIE